MRAILRGGAAPGRHAADADHLCAAAEAGCSVFLTRDGRILRKRADLEASLPAGFRILAIEELMAAWDAGQFGATQG